MLNIVANVACALVLFSQADVQSRKNEFSCKLDSTGRFVAVERLGNNQVAYVTVFEFVEEVKLLRKLYETKLLNNDEQAVFRMLSKDGRFFVTLDDLNHSGTGPLTVVIYDLARQEHTAYAGKDFLSKTLRESLDEHSHIPGFRWFSAKDVEFNEDCTKLCPTRPENCATVGVPFVVIDLPSRTVSVKPIDSVDPKSLTRRVQLEWGWKPSTETIETDKTILPQQMIRTRNGRAEQTFELTPDRTTYKVPNTKSP